MSGPGICYCGEYGGGVHTRSSRCMRPAPLTTEEASPPQDDIVAGLRLVSNELGAQRRYALRKRVDRAIAALKGDK